MKNEIDGKYELAIELIQETIDFMVETGVPLEIIANLDLTVDILEDICEISLDSYDLDGEYLHSSGLH